MTTSLTSILQTSQAFPLEQILIQKPAYMNKLIDYISVVPDPFLMNQRECYYYPSKSVQILNGIGVYRQIVKKQQKKQIMIDATKLKQKDKRFQQQKVYQYPFLDRLFKNLKTIENEQILLGYVDRVMFSLTKKTPEIYEFFKDNEDALMTILNNDKILFAMKQFLNLFLTQSTMMLYVFLKNMVLRTLMFRIVEAQNTGPIIYQMLCDFYSELLKSYITQTNQEDKEQIIEVLKNIEQQNFIALLALKITPDHHRRTYFIAKIMNQIATSPNSVSHLVSPYVDTYTEYLQSYEQSQDFMLVIMPDQLMMLKLILKICSQQKDTLIDVKQQLIKRLLVYCNVHQKNSILHTMLFALIEILYTQGNKKILIKPKIIQFLKNNFNEATSINFKGLIKRICIFYSLNQLDADIQIQQEKQFVKKFSSERKEKLQKTQYFKEPQSQLQVSSKNTSLYEQKQVSSNNQEPIKKAQQQITSPES